MTTPNDGDEHGGDGAEDLSARSAAGDARLPGERRANRRRRRSERVRVAGAAARAARRAARRRRTSENEPGDRRAGVNGEGRRAQEPIEPGFGASHVADVLQGELVRVSAPAAHEPKVRQE